MVNYIEYGGEKLPIRITFTVLKKYQGETKKSIEDLDALSTDLTLIEPLFYYALEAGHKADKKVFEIKREEIDDILDECWQEFLENMDKFIYFGANAKPVQDGKKK